MVQDWFDNVPKAELHLHLEGAIPHDALWELVQKYGGDPTVPTLESLRERFKFRDFAHFIELWIWKNGFLREYDDFAFFSEAIAYDLVRQNIRYAEAFLSPGRFELEGLDAQRIIESVRTGLSRFNGVEVALITDLTRDLGPENALNLVGRVNELREQQGVIGVGLGGSEHDWPPELFADAYTLAKDLGLHVTAHAGEAAGANSVWDAIHALGVERIGHGTRSEEDDRLLDHLAESQIPLEMCPLSNVATRVVDDISQHPIRRYVERGLMVTVNTDDPSMFGNSLAEEYRTLENVFGFNRNEVRELILNGIRASWLPDNRKADLIGSFTADSAWL